VTFCAFDLLFSDGRNVMGLPLIERKEMLQHLLAPLRGKLVVVGDLPAQAELFQEAVVGARLEGFVAKRRDSVYTPGVRSPHWLKIKRPGWQEGRSWRT
jgi:ATP-dependent DNA ligase